MSRKNTHEDNEENNKKKLNKNDKAIYEYFSIKFDYVCI